MTQKYWYMVNACQTVADCERVLPIIRAADELDIDMWDELNSALAYLYREYYREERA